MLQKPNHYNAETYDRYEVNFASGVKAFVESKPQTFTENEFTFTCEFSAWGKDRYMESPEELFIIRSENGGVEYRLLNDVKRLFSALTRAYKILP